MGFSREIKEKCLVDSARRCCVCHKYKGVKVEIHHIVPSEQGGKDSEDNAIALCFDCHSDAGHYYAKHPKGTKFSSSELRKHKRAWRDIIKSGNIQQPKNITDELVARHLLCNSWDIGFEIANKNFSQIPVNNPLLFENNVLEFMRRVLSDQEESYRNAAEYGECFQNEESILEKYPIAQKVTRTKDSTFHIERALLDSDIDVLKDQLTKAIFNERRSAPELGQVFYYYDGCGGGEFQELFKLRSVSFLFLSLENVSSKPVLIKGYTAASRKDDCYKLFNFNLSNNLEKSYTVMPSMAIKPNETVLIAEAVILHPFNDTVRDPISEETRTLDTVAHWQSYSRIVLEKNVSTEQDIIGTFALIESISTSVSETEESIHPFDFTNYYAINRGWDCGCCPHIFVKISKQSDWEYLGETLYNSQRSQISDHTLNSKTECVIIAEVEKEISYIESVQLVDSLGHYIALSSKCTLYEGDMLKLEIPHYVHFPCQLIVKGYYKTIGIPSFSAEARVHRNSLVSKKLMHLNRQEAVIW